MTGQRGVTTAIVLAFGIALVHAGWASGAEAAEFPTPVRQVVVIFQENHSFDNVLGRLCAVDHRCNGAKTGILLDGSRIPLARASDLVPNVGHGIEAQVLAINGGAMNGWPSVRGCDATLAYRCYTQYTPAQVPNLSALARTFAISDATFETSRTGSWASHLALAASNPDGFFGGPVRGTGPDHGPGGGCDSEKDAMWQPPDHSSPILVPTCVPDQFGSGPYRTSPVPYEPTIMTRVDQGGLSWTLFAADGATGTGPGTGYEWSVCPTFAECLYTSQIDNFVPSADVIAAAQSGNLPNLSLIVPDPPNSQHNTQSMAVGDNWIGSIVGAVENSPQWASTTIFITYDDCGCFYDHVNPPPEGGIRVPMVIVGPYVKAGYTDSGATTFNGMLAYIESVFNLPPISARDAEAYNYANAFDYSQLPLPPVTMKQTRVPAPELRWIASHQPARDDIT